ncbi:GGDEF domain-containing protein [Pseudoteredinibacter isoporae]|uniref:GGDEF domain-containing protein n=1 Tax=Pseudoteredinibacter isoporae TaxID=570281 RepID=UPI003101BC28
MVTSVQISSRASKAKEVIAPSRIAVPKQDLSDELFRLTQRLQTSLELEQILEIFFQQIQQHVSIGGMVYTTPCNQHIKLGRPNIHHVDYQLSRQSNDGDDGLGGVVFSRAKRFAEQELILIESFLGPLIYPLRNALLYRDALAAAMCDPLTKTGNRAAMSNALQREIQLANRYHQALSMMVIDIDHFKAVNDNYGHAAGDDVICSVAKAITTVCRETDLTFRFGGEEFVVLLNKTDAAGARVIAERVRRYIAGLNTKTEQHDIAVTASIGTAELNQDDDSISLFERADSALYKAKQQGRNQVVSYDLVDEVQRSLLGM